MLVFIELVHQIFHYTLYIIHLTSSILKIPHTGYIFFNLMIEMIDRIP